MAMRKELGGHDGEHEARRAPPPGPSRYPTLAWATAMAILLGGLNALVQIVRVALGH